MELTRVVRFHETGGPEVLKVEGVPLTEPRANEVRIRVEALSLNRADLLWRMGAYIEDPQLPSGIGYDVAGIVDAVGPDVTSLRIGSRVSSFPIASLRRYGNHGETAIYPEDGLIEYPAELSPEQATAVNTTTLTAYFPLVEVANTSPGDVVVMTAGSSATALAALQVARLRRAVTIATTRTREKAPTLAAAGFDHVIVVESEDVTARVLELTGGQGAHVVYDAVAGAGLEALARATRVRGHIVVYGALGTMNGEITPLPLLSAFERTIRLYAGYKIYDFTGHPQLGLPRDDAATARGKDFLLNGLRSGDLRPRIDRVFNGLEQYADAHRYMESNVQSGKIVVSLR
ncbi:zinc-dependent alcohol dehydrogenase family protein [Kribbella sp. VKM Ac-2566]|uniref:zinc-dependent alcohol dehydrogenase family protein n=1 Tax=Kribbella sp. VKM Ac-2566 TaxID=2512218 RepID=UPI0010EB46AF|nr:zinc-dependent alcohol dehydrogenase family protein [Kribbella sp. VKM Ac-2566]TDX08268.1 NADPH:quinone reductase-like Zn-dependent oxidoreductase [Kribbella sp. VKM Ac-2566]